MFNVGGPEVLVILLVALIVLGPKELPRAVRSVGQVMGELRKISSGFQAELQSALDPLDIRGQGSEPTGNATTMAEADITETVAHTPLGADGATRAADATDTPAPEGSHLSVVDRSAPDPVDSAVTGAPAAPEAAESDLATPRAPAIDPADRAAG